MVAIYQRTTGCMHVVTSNQDIEVGSLINGFHCSTSTVLESLLVTSLTTKSPTCVTVMCGLCSVTTARLLLSPTTNMTPIFLNCYTVIYGGSWVLCKSE